MANQMNLKHFFTDPNEVQLKYLATINPTKSKISEVDPKTEVTFVPLEGFGTDGEIIESDVKQLSEVYDGYTYFSEDDIAIAKITPSFENGKGAICKNLKNGIGFGSTELHILRAREDVDTRYLWYVLRSKPFKDEAEASMRGVAGQKRIPSEFLKSYKITNISASDQRAISEFLDSHVSLIDSLLKQTTHLLDLLESKRESLIHRYITGEADADENTMDTGVPWLGKIPTDWDVAKLGWYYDIQLGKMLDGNQDMGNNPEPYLRNKDVHWWNINIDNLPKMDFSEVEKEKYQLKRGDVLVCEGGYGLGRSAVWTYDDVDCYYQKALHRVRPKDQSQNSRFFCYFMEFADRRGIFTSRSNVSSIGHLTVEKLEKQNIPIPPREEQDRIVRELDNVTRQIVKTTEKVKDLENYLQEKRQALITKAVTRKSNLTHS